jgi:hypothetical protein
MLNNLRQIPRPQSRIMRSHSNISLASLEALRRQGFSFQVSKGPKCIDDEDVYVEIVGLEKNERHAAHVE